MYLILKVRSSRVLVLHEVEGVVQLDEWLEGFCIARARTKCTPEPTQAQLSIVIETYGCDFLPRG